MFQLDAGSVFLSVSPLYHATGRFNIRVIECGGTCVDEGRRATQRQQSG